MIALLDDWHDVGSTLDLGLLRPLLRVIDEEIAEVDSRCDRDPSGGDTFGWYDDWEALAGLGFGACQQFLNKVYRADEAAKGTNAGKSLKKIRKARTEIRWGALGKGAMHACGVTYAQAVDAAANFWKHHGEWIPGHPMGDEDYTRKVLEKVLASSEPRSSTGEPYVLANVLHVLVKPEQGRFAHLLPWLEEWRDVVASGS